jgi:glycosyltransferase involved in cell wall biosynthesis
MARFAKIKNGGISFISDKPFICDKVQIIKVPLELDEVSSSDIISNYRIQNGKFRCRSSKKCRSELKVALVSNWKMFCGIASYAESLWSETIKLVGDYKLFVEKNDVSTGPLNVVAGQIIPSDKVEACWKRGEPTKDLVAAIKAYDPDIVWIQHEFGLWPNARHWLSMLSQLSDYRVIVTMHSIFHHKDKTICEAAIPEIVSHLEGGRKLLAEEKQVSGKVYVIPHGCDPCVSRERLWNFYKSEHTFMQFGFGFRYKGYENAIKTTAVLKQKYPDVFFTGLFSESPHARSEHQIYFNELMSLVDTLGVQENVALIRGYQSDATLDSYIRTNRATLFPYVSSPEHEVFGVSGAARFVMSKAVPVITTSVNHFSDLPTIKADTPEQMAAALDRLFSNPQEADLQVEKQIVYLTENSWKNVAERYVKLFENPNGF